MNQTRISRDELDHFIEQAIVETFDKFMKTQVSCKRFEPKERHRLKRNISGVVGLVRDDSIEGTFSINFEFNTLRPILSKFFKKEVELSDRMTTESVAELTNMMYGIIKEHLNNRNCGYQMCLPVVTSGSCHDIFSSVEGSRSLFEVESPSGTFWCEMNLHKIGINSLLEAS